MPAGAATDGSQHAEGENRQTGDLSRRLIRGEGPEQDAMGQIIARMKEVEHRLGRSFDPGSDTQTLQQRIIDDLDTAIASAIRHGARRTWRNGQLGDQRRRTRRSGESRAGSKQGGGSQEADSVGVKGEPQATDGAGPFRESRRGWGHLPPRDREEVIQGINEQSLEKFRQWIERYYRALAEGEEE